MTSHATPLNTLLSASSMETRVDVYTQAGILDSVAVFLKRAPYPTNKVGFSVQFVDKVQ